MKHLEELTIELLFAIKHKDTTTVIRLSEEIAKVANTYKESC